MMPRSRPKWRDWYTLIIAIGVAHAFIYLAYL